MNKEAIESFHAKFRSGNDIPVERAVVLRSEYEAVCELIQKKIRIDKEKAPFIHNIGGYAPRIKDTKTLLFYIEDYNNFPLTIKGKPLAINLVLYPDNTLGFDFIEDPWK